MQKQQNTEPEAINLPQEPNVANQPPAYRSYGHTQTTPGYPQQPIGDYPMQPTKGYQHVPNYPTWQRHGIMQQPGPSGNNNTTQVVMTVSNENIFGVLEGEMRGRREGGRRGEKMGETKGMERKGKGKRKEWGRREGCRRTGEIGKGMEWNEKKKELKEKGLEWNGMESKRNGIERK